MPLPVIKARRPLDCRQCADHEGTKSARMRKKALPEPVEGGRSLRHLSNPDVLRKLYSAIEGVTIPPDTPIDINTLTDILYKDQINDVSFIIDNRLVVLVEHQSSINDNIPLRLLMYIARLYEKIVNRKKLYQVKLEKIPKPEFIVLYNGKYKYPDHKELRLSNAFKDIECLKMTDTNKIPLELIVQVYNVNHGHNSEILKKCETLDSYSVFVNKIREYQKKENSLEKGVRNAINYCIKKNILKEYLEAHGEEALNYARHSRVDE